MRPPQEGFQAVIQSAATAALPQKINKKHVLYSDSERRRDPTRQLWIRLWPAEKLLLLLLLARSLRAAEKAQALCFLGDAP